MNWDFEICELADWREMWAAAADLEMRRFAVVAMCERAAWYWCAE